MPEQTPPCKVVKRSVKIAGHATSVTLEAAFWTALEKIAAERGLSMNALIAEVDATNKGKCTLSAALRVYILERVT